MPAGIQRFHFPDRYVAAQVGFNDIRLFRDRYPIKTI
jgi:hypothetical protein